MMKKTKQSFLLVHIVLGFLQLGFSQDVAHAQPTSSSKYRATQSPIKSLKDVLIQMKEHYKVDILYFDRIVVGHTVSDNAVKLNLGIEQNLNAVLKPIGLDFKKN